MHANRVGVLEGYVLHNQALFNTWPEDAAFEKWGALGTAPASELIDEYGPKLYYDPDCQDAAFGGMVDGLHYAGEYNIHSKRTNTSGDIISDKPVNTHNHLIKAVNYLLFWRFGISGEKREPKVRRSVKRRAVGYRVS